MNFEIDEWIAKADDLSLVQHSYLKIPTNQLENWKMNLIAVSEPYLFIGCGRKVKVYLILPHTEVHERELELPRGPDIASNPSINNMKVLQISGERRLVLVTMDANVVMYDVSDLEKDPIAFSNYDESYPDNSTWSLDAQGDLLVVGSNSHLIKYWNLSTGESRRLHIHSHNIPCVSLVPNTDLLLSTSIDSSCVLSSLTDMKRVAYCKPVSQWGWAIKSIPFNSVSLSERVQKTNVSNLTGYYKSRLPTNYIDQAREIVWDERIAKESPNVGANEFDFLVLHSSKEVVSLIDPNIRDNNKMHVLCTYKPVLDDDFHFNSRISLLEVLPEISMCILGNQGSSNLLFLKMLKKPRGEISNQVKQHPSLHYEYYFLETMRLRINGMLLGLDVDNQLDRFGRAWIYIIYNDGEVVTLVLKANSYNQILEINY